MFSKKLFGFFAILRNSRFLVVISAASAIIVANLESLFPRLRRLFRPQISSFRDARVASGNSKVARGTSKIPTLGRFFSQKNFPTHRRHRRLWSPGDLDLTYFFSMLASFFRPSKKALTEAPVGRTWGRKCSGFPGASADPKLAFFLFSRKKSSSRRYAEGRLSVASVWRLRVTCFFTMLVHFFRTPKNATLEVVIAARGA